LHLKGTPIIIDALDPLISSYPMQRKSHALSKRPVSSYPRWKVVSFSVVTAFAAFTAGGVLVTGFNPGTSSTASTWLAGKWNLSATSECRTMGSVEFKVTSNSPAHIVFKLNDVWHQNRPCLESILAKASSSPPTTNNSVEDIHDFMYYQLLYVLSRKNVVFDKNSAGKNWSLKDVMNNKERFNEEFTHIIYTGENDQPYDGMGAADLAYWALLKPRRLLKARAAAMRTMPRRIKKSALLLQKR
jgi:hypothetical protein